MCGIFGAIGRPDVGVIRSLAITNRERGTDSLGFFSSNGRIRKQAGDPLSLLGRGSFDDYLETVCRKGWFVAGHTRHATQGKVNKRNAHPFRYGRIVGSHNGIVGAPDEYEVDSQYLFHLLSHYDGVYQKALELISGYWGLSWFDGCNFWLANHNNELSYVRYRGAWYYSSDNRHLKAVLGCGEVEYMDDGEVLRFDMKSRKPERCADFVSYCPQGFYADWRDGTKGERDNDWGQIWFCDTCQEQFDSFVDCYDHGGGEVICEYCAKQHYGEWFSTNSGIEPMK